MSRKSKQRKAIRRDIAKKAPAKKKEIKAKKKETAAKLKSWLDLPVEQWTEARKARNGKQ